MIIFQDWTKKSWKNLFTQRPGPIDRRHCCASLGPGWSRGTSSCRDWRVPDIKEQNLICVFYFTHFIVHCICVLFLCQAGHTTKTRFVQFWHLADSPHVVSFLHCVVHLLPGEPKLPQHPLKAVALGRWHQLLWSNETVGKTRDDLVVRDLELLQVSKQHLALLPEAAMGNEDNGTIHLKIYKIGQFGQNLNMFTSPNQSMKVTSASSRSRQGKGSFRRAL